MHLALDVRLLRPPPQTCRIVLHADDLGMNEAVDGGILHAFRHGVLTSTSVLANGPTAASALAAMRAVNSARAVECWCESHGRRRLHEIDQLFDLGVHLNLTQGRPLTGASFPEALLDQQGAFLPPVQLFVALGAARPDALAAVYEELAAQVAFVVDHGISPTHFNGHQYLELIPRVTAMLTKLMNHFNIRVVRCPCESHLITATLLMRGPIQFGKVGLMRCLAASLKRQVRIAGGRFTDGFFGAAHAGHVTFAALTRRLKLPVDCRTIEIAMHPGDHRSDVVVPPLNDPWTDPLAKFRRRERDLLCSDELIELLSNRGFQLGRLASLSAGVVS